MESYMKILKKQLKQAERELLKEIAKLAEGDIRALPTSKLEELVWNYKDRLSHIQDS